MSNLIAKVESLKSRKTTSASPKGHEVRHHDVIDSDDRIIEDIVMTGEFPMLDRSSTAKSTQSNVDKNNKSNLGENNKGNKDMAEDDEKQVENTNESKEPKNITAVHKISYEICNSPIRFTSSVQFHPLIFSEDCSKPFPILPPLLSPTYSQTYDPQPASRDFYQVG